MTYDRLTVTLLALLEREDRNSANAQLARFLLRNAGEVGDVSVRELATMAHVGAGTVSRFAREAGFAGFAELKEAFSQSGHLGEASGDEREETFGLAERVGEAARLAESTVDRAALARLVEDLRRYDKVSAFGLLKGQSAALDLQVDLLMQGKWVDTCVSVADQAEHISHGTADDLFVVFSRTASYFECCDLGVALRRSDRPRIWVVCGDCRRLPPFVYDRVLFSLYPDLSGHPHQLECIAALIARSYARRVAASRPAHGS